MYRRLEHYLSEIVSLTVLALLVAALASGQLADGAASYAGRDVLAIADRELRIRHDGE